MCPSDWMCCIVKGMEPAQDTERPTEPPLLNITFYYSSQVEYSGIHYAVVLVHKKKQINPHTHTQNGRLKHPILALCQSQTPAHTKWSGMDLHWPLHTLPIQCAPPPCVVLIIEVEGQVRPLKTRSSAQEPDPPIFGQHRVFNPCCSFILAALLFPGSFL